MTAAEIIAALRAAKWDELPDLLTIECELCHGSGKWARNKKKKPHECPGCHGVGVVENDLSRFLKTIARDAAWDLANRIE